MDKKNSKTFKVISIIFIIIAVNFLLYDFYIIPRYKLYLSIKSSYKNKEERLNIIKKKDISSIKSRNEILKNDIDNLNKLIPNKIDTPALSYEFYNSCIAYGVSGDEIRFELPKYGSASEPLMKLTINLKISGANDKVTTFIENITNITKRELNLKGITLLYQDNNNVSADIIFYQYIQK